MLLDPIDRRLTPLRAGLLIVALMTFAAVLEHWMGRSFICTNGHIRLWVGSVKSPELSQQLLDWYSPSHLLHGILLYAAWSLIPLSRSFSTKLTLTAVLEVGWELLENSPVIIDRYRQTAAQGYVGDSVLNSMSDVTCCLLGFVLASKLPVWISALIVVSLELLTLVLIRDNLFLNVLMLIHPFAAIRRWQMSGM